MVAYYLYTAWNTEELHFGFTHDPYVDGAHLAPRGYDRLFVANVPLPIDIAVATMAAWKDASPVECGSSGASAKGTRFLPWSRLPLISRLPFIKRIYPFAGKGDFSPWLKLWRHIIGGELQRRGFHRGRQVSVKTIDLATLSRHSIPQDFLDPVAQVLWGRMLTYDEIQSAANQIIKVNPYPLRDTLQSLALDGQIEIWPGVASPLQGYGVCRRCGESQGLEKVDCPLCGRSDCSVCPSCRGLGEMRNCRELYQGRVSADLGGTLAFPGIKPLLPFELTPAQKAATTELGQYVEEWLDGYLVMRGGEGSVAAASLESPSGVNASLEGPSRVIQPEERAALVWAVCGAGKTEIAFRAVALALRRGLRVVFAIPRRDVVVELAHRAEAAFPQVPVNVLYGGVPAPERMGSLVIATTHQLLRFAHIFDLAILDEADAYPYAGSAMLYHAFRRSVQPGGLKVYMTATPAPAMLAAARRNSLKLITVPARHHGYPVPIPQLVIDKGFQVPTRPSGWSSRVSASQGSNLHLPQKFWVRLRESMEAGNRVFIFVPRIWLVSILVEAICAKMSGCSQGEGPELPEAAVWGTHSQDTRRDEKRIALQAKSPAVMVTTSVLERGITVSRADVIVLYAHDVLYDARTLIQMAGRSGRTTEYPQGQVWFMAATATRDLRWAIDNLEEINTTARRRGLLMAEVMGNSP